MQIYVPSERISGTGCQASLRRFGSATAAVRRTRDDILRLKSAYLFLLLDHAEEAVPRSGAPMYEPANCCLNFQGLRIFVVIHKNKFSFPCGKRMQTEIACSSRRFRLFQICSVEPCFHYYFICYQVSHSNSNGL